MLSMSTSRTLSFLAIIATAVLAACSKTEDAPPPIAEPPVPAAAPISQNVKSFTIGELAALSLRDGAMELPNDNKVFGVGRTPEEVAAVLAGAGQPTDKLALTIEPLLVTTKDRVMLFDTGAGGLFGPGSGLLLGSFTEAGVDPQSVTDIFISHSHGDHVGGLVNGEGALTFPNATIHISQPEWNHLKGQQQFAAMVTAISPKVKEFTPGAELVPGTVNAVDIKGHTPGHSGYLVTSGADSLLYVGDSMHHFVVSVQKPEWTIAFDGDSPVASRSRADLIAASVASGQRIYAVHFPFPGIGKFEKQGDVVVWVGE
jgi:glyoxylase-like metal-dependent hydrolase (beta-lactamase superfamily II)